MKTISIDIKGQTSLSNEWIWTVHNNEYKISPEQKTFIHTFKMQVQEGWNEFVCQHSIDHHASLHKNGHSYSFINVTGVYINDTFCKKGLLEASGSVAQSSIHEKELFLKELGEPFVLPIKFYYPLEHWPFALLDIKPEAKYGPYFSTH